MTAVRPSARTGAGDVATAPQSAAAPSPFPPIADHGFNSDWHTGALIAPDGATSWLCVPRFDAPSVSGTLIDRQAGYFRLAPFGINVPSSRRYEPGTNVLETTWHTPSGWGVVRDALTMGPRRAEDVISSRRAPGQHPARRRSGAGARAHRGRRPHHRRRAQAGAHLGPWP